MSDRIHFAEKLWQAGAVRLSPHQPYTWASGWKSPVYCDNRVLLSHPAVRESIKSELCNVVFRDYPEAEVIAGVATAGIAWGAMIADQLKLPFCYVRPEPKSHGMGRQIEGELRSGAKVVVIEDLVSTGKSSLQAVEGLRAAGGDVLGMVALFSYEFAETTASLQDASLPFYSLTGYASLLESTKAKGELSAEEESLLLRWRENPSAWGKES